MDKATGNQHLHFTSEIWTNNIDLTPSSKKDKVQIVENNKLIFLYIKISWYPKEDQKFGVFSRKGHQLNYIGKGSTHTPINIRMIPSEVINRLEKLASRKFTFHSERVEMSTLATQMPSTRRA